MVSLGDIREGMQVLGSEGGMVGRVSGLHGDHLHVEPDAPEPAGSYIVPRAWVARVDEHVHLNREAALVRDTWTSHGADGATSPDDVREPAHDGTGKSRVMWAIGAILLLMVLFLGIRGCGYAMEDSNSAADAKAEQSVSGN